MKTLLEDCEMNSQFLELVFILERASFIAMDLEDYHEPDYYISCLFDEVAAMIELVRSKVNTIKVLSDHRLQFPKKERLK